jgi:hypothetical protein
MQSELDHLYLTALKEDRQRRELEDRLDQVLIQELDDSKVRHTAPLLLVLSIWRLWLFFE